MLEITLNIQIIFNGNKECHRWHRSKTKQNRLTFMRDIYSTFTRLIRQTIAGGVYTVYVPLSSQSVVSSQ